MKGRPNKFENKELILKAHELFWKKGYSATSLFDLSNATGAGAGSFYNKFKGVKKELFKKSLLQRREDLNIFKINLESNVDPIKLIKGYFINVATQSKKSNLKGYIVANTIVE